MRPSAYRRAALALAIASISCHSTDWETLCDTDPSASGCPGASTSASTGGTGGSATGGGGGEGGDLLFGGMGGMGGMGRGTGGAISGAGGASPPMCGNGIIDQGEECDAGGGPSAVGCTAMCEVDCSGGNDHEDPMTHVCYRASAVTATWSASRQACQTWGGDLVAIASAAEKAFVTSFVIAASWSGGNDSATEGAFEWSNGETWQFTDWDAGQPDADDCVRIRGPGGAFNWVADACTDLRQSICERPPPGTP